jgi:hypothetical protein
MSSKGTSTCLEISKRANEIADANGGKAEMVKSAMEYTEAIVNPLSAVDDIVNSLRSKNNVKQKLANILQVDVSSLDKMQSDQQCTQVFSGGQSNVIDMSGCAEMCKLHGANSCVLSNVSMSNDLDVQFACTMHGIMDVLASQTASVDNAAVLSIMQNAKGILAGNDTNAEPCNEVRSDMSASRYLQSTQKCAAKASFPQENILKCASAIDLSLHNSASLYMNCMATETKKVVAKQKQVVKNTTETNTTQTAEGVSSIALIIMALVVAFAIYKVSSNKPIAIGIGIVVVVVACLLVYVLLVGNKKKEKNKAHRKGKKGKKNAV